MKIVEVSTAAYRWPRHKPITNGLHTYTHAGLDLVKVETDAGITGLGLGLYISREIMERHGGRLRAESPPDGGARFVIALPLTPS